MASFRVLGFLLFFVLVSFSSACDHRDRDRCRPLPCNRCVHQSKATFTPRITSGACGYGPMASSYFNGYLLVSGSPSVFKQGAGCGACYEVRCKNPALCKNQGALVAVIDSHGDDNNTFVMIKEAYAAMANKGRSQDLLKFGGVDIEYKRVPCVYKRNMALRVEEYSKKPYYLAIKVLYQGGQTYITAVDVAQAGSKQWISMRRRYEAVWDTNAVLTGPLNFRFLVNSGYGSKYIFAPKVLPTYWKNGVIYDTGVQITDVALETCYSSQCSKNTW